MRLVSNGCEHVLRRVFVGMLLTIAALPHAPVVAAAEEGWTLVGGATDLQTFVIGPESEFAVREDGLRRDRRAGGVAGAGRRDGRVIARHPGRRSKPACRGPRCDRGRSCLDRPSDQEQPPQSRKEQLERHGLRLGTATGTTALADKAVADGVVYIGSNGNKRYGFARHVDVLRGGWRRATSLMARRQRMSARRSSAAVNLRPAKASSW